MTEIEVMRVETFALLLSPSGERSKVFVRKPIVAGPGRMVAPRGPGLDIDGPAIPTAAYRS